MLALWLALPLEDEPTSIGQRAWHDRRTTALMIGLGAFLVLVVLMLRALESVVHRRVPLAVGLGGGRSALDHPPRGR